MIILLNRQNGVDTFIQMNQCYYREKQQDESIDEFSELFQDYRDFLSLIDSVNFSNPFKIQCQIISKLINDKVDILAKYQYGTGKTCAAIISMHQHIDKKIEFPQAIYICHSLELANHAYYLSTRINKCLGGICCDKNKPPSTNARLLFGTPDVLNYFLQEQLIDISHVGLIVFDEADVIFDKNDEYLFPTLDLMKHFNKNAQYAFISSTFAESQINTIQELRKGITTILPEETEKTFNPVDHYYAKVSNEEFAKEWLLQIVNSEDVQYGNIAIFVNSNEKAQEIYDFLKSENVGCQVYSSELTLEERNKITRSKTIGNCRVLVTTDLLSRGIDFKFFNLVINFHIPSTNNIDKDSDTYEHRASRIAYSPMPQCFSFITGQEEGNHLNRICSKKGINIRYVFEGNKYSLDDLKKMTEGQLTDIGICPTCFDRENEGCVYHDNRKQAVVYEDKDIECLFIGKPRSIGHMIISTKKHYHDMTEAPEETNDKIFRFANELMKILVSVYNCESIFMHNVRWIRKSLSRSTYSKIF